MPNAKRILITGGARGLGEVFAKDIAKSGAQIVIADILEKEGQSVVEQIRQNGGKAHFTPVDLAEPDSVEQCADQALSILDGLDGLINNGAIATGIGGVSMEKIDVSVWDKVMAINVRGTWLMTRAVSHALRESTCGRVINLASDTAMWGAPELMHYVASKGAVIAMTRAMSREMGCDAVTVNAIAPGLTVIDATEYVPEHRHRLYMEGRSIAREQMPDDLTGLVNFLLSDSAGFITGQLIPVNGGFCMN